MIDAILRTISQLLSQIQNDTYNLTRDDQEAIQLKVNQLKDFIPERYGQHKCNV